MLVYIDSKPYVLAVDARIDWRYGQVLTTPFRLSGIPTRQDNQLVSRFPLTWHKGLGFSRQDRETGYGVGGLRDADADTAHRILTLPHRAQDETNPDPDGSNGTATDTVLNSWVNYGGNLIGAFKDIGGADPYQDVRSRVYGATSDNWTGGALIKGDTGNVIHAMDSLDMCVHKGAAYCLLAHEDDTNGSINDAEYKVHKQTGGPATSWDALSNHPGAGTLWLDYSVTTDYLQGIPSNGGRPLGVILDGPTASRNDLIAAIQEDASSSGGSTDQTRVYHTADAGATAWTNTGNVQGKPRGKGVWRDPFTAGFPPIPVISTTQNVYLVDAANSLVTPILPDYILSGDNDDGYMVIGNDGALYVANANGDVYRVTIPSDGSLSTVNIGPVTRVPNGGDGLVSAKRGEITAMATSASFLYVAIKGATYSHIVRFRYDDHTWHSFTVRPDTRKIYRMIFSNADDGVQRLHYVADAGSTMNMVMFENPDESLAVITGQTESTGTVQFPVDDFGDPNTAAGIYQAVIEADDLSASTSGEYIDYKTGSDGADWGTDDRGDFLSGDKDLLFASGAGVSANVMNSEITLNRDAGTNTDTPKVKSLEVQAVNSQAVLRTVSLPIDLEATDTYFNRPVEDQITDLETIYKTATQVLVSIGKITDFYAGVVNPPSYDLRVTNSDEQQSEGELKGVAFVTFTQLLEGV